MKVIDNKGKFFGLINLIDLLVIIVLLALIIGTCYRLFSSRMNVNGESTFKEEEVYVTLYSSLVVPEVAKSLKPGDKLVANNAFTNAEIVSISSKKADYVATDLNGNAVLSQHPLWEDVTVVIKDTANTSNPIFKVANQECRVGNAFILKTPKVETNCRVRAIDLEEPANNAVKAEETTLETEKTTEKASAEAVQ